MSSKYRDAGPRGSGQHARNAGVALGLLLLAGCCDQASMEACERERAAQQAAAPAPPVGQPPAAQSPMRFDITASPGVEIAAAVADSRCLDGKAAAAEVRVDWTVTTPGVTGVRIKVVADGVADKVWAEAGSKGQETTGPWMSDGMRLRFEGMPGGAVLGELRAVAGPCT